jgi:homopolymeric O-antigen transport system ATP-binding protein
MDPEVLLVDELLAVGDAAFQEKCFARIRQFRQSGKTLMCVSHSSVIREICDRAIWLDHGELMMAGRIGEVIEAYQGHGSTAAM